MSAPPRGGRGRGRGAGGYAGRGGGGGYGGGGYGGGGGYEEGYGYDGYEYSEGYDSHDQYEAPSHYHRGGGGGGGGGDGYGPPRDYRGKGGSGEDYRGGGGGGAGPRGRAGLGYTKPEKAPEEPIAPPPVVDGYAEEGMNAMPSTGIDYEKNQYQCFVCNIWTNTEVILNAHLSGKTHIKKLEQAGLNSFLPPVSLGAIPANEALKEEKWKTGEKRKYSEIDPTNKGHFSCEVCNLEFNSRVVYDTHMQGKKHARMLKSIDEIRTQNVEVSCTVCNFVATSAVHLEAHLQGKNHKKRVEAAGKGVPGGTPVSAPDAEGPKMLAQMYANNPKKPKTDYEGYGEEQYEEGGGEEWYEEGGYDNTGGYGGGGANGSGAAGYYGY